MLTLRPATPSDAGNLFAWRNDPETRANSRTSDPVPWRDHVAWLNADAPKRRLMIAERDGVPVGTVRLDIGDDEAEISWTVAPAARSQGVGTAMVQAALASAPRRLIAYIKPENAPSLRLAERCGFRPVGVNQGLTVWEYTATA